MSRSFAQRSGRSKNFIIVNTQHPTDPGDLGYFQAIPPADFEHYLTLVSAPYNVTGNVYSTATLDDMYGLYGRINDGATWFYDDRIGTVLKDLGRTIEFKVGGSLFARWNLVQMVNDTITEDNSGLETNTFYITTFFADTSGTWEVVGVARTG